MNNLYHEICHRYVHADREYNVLKLPITCRSVFFIIQHLYYLSSGNFILTKRELLECVQDEDKAVLELSISLQEHINYDFDRAFLVLFHWCQNTLSKIWLNVFDYIFLYWQNSKKLICICNYKYRRKNVWTLLLLCYSLSVKNSLHKCIRQCCYGGYCMLRKSYSFFICPLFVNFLKVFQSVYQFPYILCYNVLCYFVSLIFLLSGFVMLCGKI